MIGDYVKFTLWYFAIRVHQIGTFLCVLRFTIG